MKNLAIFLFLMLSITSSFSQKTDEDDGGEIYSRPSAGIGTGLDYGGIGVKINVLPSDYVAVFLGTGYNSDRFTYCGGAFFRAFPRKLIVPVVQLVYGYNAIITSGFYSKSYYGISGGVGLEIHFRNRSGFFNIGANYALTRSKAYKDYVNRFGHADNTETVATLAYHFEF